MNYLILTPTQKNEIEVSIKDVISIQPVPAKYKVSNPDKYEDEDMFVEFASIQALQEAQKATGWLNAENKPTTLFMPYVTGGHIIVEQGKPTRYFNHWKLVAIKEK